MSNDDLFSERRTVDAATEVAKVVETELYVRDYRTVILVNRGIAYYAVEYMRDYVPRGFYCEVKIVKDYYENIKRPWPLNDDGSYVAFCLPDSEERYCGWRGILFIMKVLCNCQHLYRDEINTNSFVLIYRFGNKVARQFTQACVNALITPNIDDETRFNMLSNFLGLFTRSQEEFEEMRAYIKRFLKRK